MLYRCLRVLLVVSIVLAIPTMASAQEKPLWSMRLFADDAPLGKIGPVVVVGSDLLVADGDTRQIVRFDRTGRVTARFGGKGAGPGEFYDIAWMGKGVGDSLYVWDRNQRRLSIFTLSGKFVRSESPEHELNDPMVFGRTAAGQWLVMTTTMRESIEQGVSVNQSFLSVNVARTVRERPGEVLTVPSKRFVKVVNGITSHLTELPAMDMSYFASCENGFIVGMGAQREVRAYDTTGRLLGKVGAAREPTVVSGAARKQMIESWAGVDNTAPQRPDGRRAQQFAKAFDALVPQRAQATEQFTIGSDRSLWLAPSPGFPHWQLLGNDGAGKPELVFPEGQWLVAMTADYFVTRSYGNDERLEFWRRPATMQSPASANWRALGACTPAVVR